MGKELVKQENTQDIISSLVLNGDISKMDKVQKVEYYNNFCNSLGLNPLTQPFQIIIDKKGKEKLYATKDCTEQLRKLHAVSVVESDTKIENGIIVTRVKVQDGTGRYDVSTGAVATAKNAEDLCNAIMKAETKAKRRATLSICGLGILEESELDTMKKEDYETVPITDIQTVQPEEIKPEEKNGSQFYIELKNKIRETLGGKMNVKQAIEQLNKLTNSNLDKFPTDEKQCENLLGIIKGKEEEIK